MNDKIFISYRNDREGGMYKELLVAWSKNPIFPDVSFEDISIGTSINSDDAYYIKRRINEKIQSADLILCLVGENTHKSDWVNWEIETAYNMGKPISAVKIDRNYTSPTKLFNKNVNWALSFTEEAILKVL